MSQCPQQCAECHRDVNHLLYLDALERSLMHVINSATIPLKYGISAPTGSMKQCDVNTTSEILYGIDIKGLSLVLGAVSNYPSPSPIRISNFLLLAETLPNRSGMALRANGVQWKYFLTTFLDKSLLGYNFAEVAMNSHNVNPHTNKKVEFPQSTPSLLSTLYAVTAVTHLDAAKASEGNPISNNSASVLLSQALFSTLNQTHLLDLFAERPFRLDKDSGEYVECDPQDETPSQAFSHELSWQIENTSTPYPSFHPGPTLPPETTTQESTTTTEEQTTTDEPHIIPTKTVSQTIPLPPELYIRVASQFVVLSLSKLLNVTLQGVPGIPKELLTSILSVEKRIRRGISSHICSRATVVGYFPKAAIIPFNPHGGMPLGIIYDNAFEVETQLTALASLSTELDVLCGQRDLAYNIFVRTVALARVYKNNSAISSVVNGSTISVKASMLALMAASRLKKDYGTIHQEILNRTVAELSTSVPLRKLSCWTSIDIDADASMWVPNHPSKKCQGPLPQTPATAWALLGLQQKSFFNAFSNSPVPTTSPPTPTGTTSVPKPQEVPEWRVDVIVGAVVGSAVIVVMAAAAWRRKSIKKSERLIQPSQNLGFF